MRSMSSCIIASLVLVAIPAFAGESPYNPGAPPSSAVIAKTPVSYYCTAQGNGESKWYVTGFEEGPHMGTPEFQTFQSDVSQAFMQYMKATYSARKVIYAHCTVGVSQSLRPSWDQMQQNPGYKETVHLDWRYEKAATPATGNASSG
jgi:hypothetical protein